MSEIFSKKIFKRDKVCAHVVFSLIFLHFMCRHLVFMKLTSCQLDLICVFFKCNYYYFFVFQVLFVFFLPVFLIFILPCIIVVRCRQGSSKGKIVKIVDNHSSHEVGFIITSHHSGTVVG